MVVGRAATATAPAAKPAAVAAATAPHAIAVFDRDDARSIRRVSRALRVQRQRALREVQKLAERHRGHDVVEARGRKDLLKRRINTILSCNDLDFTLTC